MNNQYVNEINRGLSPAGRSFWWTALALAVVMAVTRLGHFGEYGGPVDASWAVFLLAGLWLRDLRLFPGFFLLAWVTDLAAFALGTPTNCYSIAYLFLVPAYGALWVAGRWASEGGIARIALATVGGSAVTFVVANAGMYLLAPSPSAPTLGAFASAVVGYIPGYLTTTAMYVAVGVLAETALRGVRRSSLV
jgi:hypothetical protein